MIQLSDCQTFSLRRRVSCLGLISTIQSYSSDPMVILITTISDQHWQSSMSKSGSVSFSLKYRRWDVNNQYVLLHWFYFVPCLFNSLSAHSAASTMSYVFGISLLKVTAGYIWPLLTAVSYPQRTAASSRRLTPARIRKERTEPESHLERGKLQQFSFCNVQHINLCTARLWQHLTKTHFLFQAGGEHWFLSLSEPWTWMKAVFRTYR